MQFVIQVLNVITPYVNTAKNRNLKTKSSLSFNSNNLTINRNGHNINGAGSNLVLSTNGQAITLVYVDATRGWAFKTNTA